MSNDISSLRGFRLKNEATEGTFESLVAADTVLLLDGATAQIESDPLIRNLARPNGGAPPMVPIRRRLRISGEMELVGPATPGEALPYSDLIKTCGHIETLAPSGTPPTTTIQPTLQNIPASSAEYFFAGERYRGVGGRGRVTSINWAINDYAKIGIEYLAKVESFAEAAVPSDDQSTFQAPTVLNEGSLTFSVAGVDLEMISLALSEGTNVVLAYSSENTTSFRAGRELTGTLRIYRPTIAALAVRQLASAGTIVAAALTVDDPAAARKHNVALGEVQIGEPTNVDVDGRRAWDLPIRLLPGTSGNADYVIEFGD